MKSKSPINFLLAVFFLSVPLVGSNTAYGEVVPEHQDLGVNSYCINTTAVTGMVAAAVMQALVNVRNG